MRVTCRASLFVLSLVAFTAAAVGSLFIERETRAAASPARAGAIVKSGAPHVPFIRNAGQTDPQVRFYTPTRHGTVFVTDAGDIVYHVPAALPLAASVVLSERVVGASIQQIDGVGLAPTRVNIFRGNDPTRWHHDLETYDAVSLGVVLDDVDVRLNASPGGVEKIFTVAPGGDPARIRVAVGGAARLHVTDAGELEAATTGGAIRFSRPIAYQDGAGGREPIEVTYAVNDRDYGFRVGDYDRTRPLVIDPAIVSTFLGGTEVDAAWGIVHDGAGHVFVAGNTASDDFPGITPGSPDPETGGCSNYDGFVAKLDDDLGTVLSATYLGGSGFSTLEAAFAIALSPVGEVYVAGFTVSADFPGITPGAADSVFSGGREGFIVRLDANLSAILSATFLGGSDKERVRGITFDPATNSLYAVGATVSSDFPGVSCPGAPDCLFQNGEGFATQLDATLSAITGSTYLGGSGGGELEEETARSVIVDPAGNVFVGGQTNSADFAAITGADATYAGATEGFVVKFGPGLTTVLATTFLGGANDDEVTSLARVDDAGGYSVAVAGDTCSPTFPGVSPQSADHQPGNINCPVNAEGFLARFDSTLSSVGATFVGGTYSEGPLSVTAPAGIADAIYVAGRTRSKDFPGIDGGSADSFLSDTEIFAAKFNLNLTAILGATYIGSADVDIGTGIAMDPSLGTTSPIFVTGYSQSESFPGIGPSSADSTSIEMDGVIAKMNNDLERTFLSNIKALKALLELLTNLDDGSVRTLNLSLDRAEHHGRHQQWPVAARQFDRFIEAVNQLAPRRRIDPDVAARLVGLAEEAQDDLVAAAREDGPRRRVPLRRFPLPDVAPSCPVPPFPR